MVAGETICGNAAGRCVGVHCRYMVFEGDGENNEMIEAMREVIAVRTMGIDLVVVVDKGLLFIDWRVKGEQ